MILLHIVACCVVVQEYVFIIKEKHNVKNVVVLVFASISDRDIAAKNVVVKVYVAMEE
jgi:hypothetical protein